VAELGRGLLLVALALHGGAAAAGTVAAARGRPRLPDAARRALVGAFAAVAAATALLVAEFLRHDFANRYVAEHSSRKLPLLYLGSAFWGGQEGSLLLWLLILSALTAAAVTVNRRLIASSLPWTVPILGAIASFFAFVLVAVSSPFATWAAPADGAGLNPSLQNPYMMAHPPMLYVGYVGLAIPFAFATAAMLSRRTDEAWIVATRRWTIGAWAFLGLGMLLGAKWAYEVIGWGGYYAWDPVENAALMPWLASTAFLHSVIIQEKKAMLRVWNVSLVSLSFCLSLLGTFLTRSGVVNSVHSFSQSPLGAWFLAFIAVVATFAAAVIMRRAQDLKAQTRLESVVSREAAFLYNNLLFVALALTILWGVLFPIVSQAFRGVPFTVGAPYYDFFLRVFGLPLLALMGIGPLLAWRRSSTAAVRRAITVPAVAALLAAGLLWQAGAASSRAGMIAYSFSVFVLAAIATEFVRGTRARHAHGSGGWVVSFLGLLARNRRRYGGYVVHAAVCLLVIGVVGSSVYNETKEVTLRPGHAASIRDYQLLYLTTFARNGPNDREVRARVAVLRGNRLLGVLEAGKNRYTAEQQVSNVVAIRTDWRRAEDLYVIAQQFRRDGSVSFKVLVNPLVNLIWLAGVVFILGWGIAVWPDRRARVRVPARSALAST
jgi:cytochrome c-type biogenesis protein CcmF